MDNIFVRTDPAGNFSTCPQPDLIEEALEEAPDGFLHRTHYQLADRAGRSERAPNTKNLIIILATTLLLYGQSCMLVAGKKATMMAKTTNLYVRLEPGVKEQADSDLRGIYEYIAFSLLEPENAAGQLERLEENILKLADMPVDHFIVFYIPDEEEKTVTVIRVVYGGRNIDVQLKNTII